MSKLSPNKDIRWKSAIFPIRSIRMSFEEWLEVARDYPLDDSFTLVPRSTKACVILLRKKLTGNSKSMVGGGGHLNVT